MRPDGRRLEKLPLCYVPPKTLLLCVVIVFPEPIVCYNVLMTDTRFKKGHQTWNKNLKGIHLSPATEFKKGQQGTNWVPVGATTVRMYHGAMRTYQKVAEPNTWRLRSQVVWEAANGPLPKGHIIHHKDRNVLNDDLANLELLSRSEHFLEHRDENEAKRLAGLRNMKKSDLSCCRCNARFSANKKAKYCSTCRVIVRREISKRYKATLKTSPPA